MPPAPNIPTNVYDPASNPNLPKRSCLTISAPPITPPQSDINNCAAGKRGLHKQFACRLLEGFPLAVTIKLSDSVLPRQSDGQILFTDIRKQLIWITFLKQSCAKSDLAGDPTRKYLQGVSLAFLMICVSPKMHMSRDCRAFETCSSVLSRQVSDLAELTINARKPFLNHSRTNRKHV